MQKAIPIMMISTHGYVAAKPELGKADTGGQVLYVLEVSRCLARMGYAVDIFTRQFEHQPQIDMVEEDVRVVRIPCGGSSFIPKEILFNHIPEWVDNTIRYAMRKGLRYQFINSHYWDAGLAGQQLADAWHIFHMHTPHSLGAWKRANMAGDAEDLERKYNFQQRIPQEKAIYDACDAVIATTSQQAAILQGPDYQVPSEKIYVIPPGYDDTRFYPVSQATRQTLKRTLQMDGPVVLSLGRLARNKGYDLLIRAMPYVLKRVPQARLMLAVGATHPTEQERAQVEELVELARSLEIQHALILRDYIPDELLANYYRAADVFALSSRYEPFGMTAVEAMACGTPTVITTEGGLWQYITWGRDALYANPLDPEAFGHAVASILEYPRVAAQLARYGAETARTHFTWTGITQRLLNVYSCGPTPVEASMDELWPTGPYATWSVSSAEGGL